jgi:CheY-like chemotaxis protein
VRPVEPTLLAVLSDINMPGMDELTLLGEIRQRFPDLPVMIVTAHGEWCGRVFYQAGRL